MRFPELNARLGMMTACASLIALGLVALLLNLPGYRPRDFARRHLARQLPELPETALLPQMRRIVQTGDEGLRVAVECLGSEREAVAEAAQVAIAEEVDGWRLVPMEKSAPRVMNLARTLASRQEPLPTSSRRFLGDLATQLLLWPARDASQAGELVGWCEIILSQAARTPGGGAPESYAAAHSDAPPLPSPARRLDQHDTADAAPVPASHR